MREDTGARIDAALALDSAWRERVRTAWVELMSIAVWGELDGAKVGAVPRLRKRALDLGEKWRSLFNERGWIPQPRERLKNALGSSLSLRDSLTALERALEDVGGGADLDAFRQRLAALTADIEGPLRARENVWAGLLEELGQGSGPGDV